MGWTPFDSSIVGIIDNRRSGKATHIRSKTIREGGAGSGDFGHAGRPGELGGSVGNHTTEEMKQIALLHAGAVHDPHSEKTQAAYNAFKDETLKQYRDLLAKGVKFEFSANDPYHTSADMRKDVAENNHLAVYNVATLPEGHPLADMAPGTGQTYNTIFRGVHDYNGHYVGNHSFGPNGELGAYQTHARMYSDAALPALASETLAQNAWVNFGPHEPWKLAARDRPFADQKAYAFPLDIAQRMKESVSPSDLYGDEDERNNQRLLQEGSPDQPRDDHGRWTTTDGLAQAAVRLTDRKGGTSISTHGEPAPTSGFIVGDRQYEQDFKVNTLSEMRRAITSFIAARAQQLSAPAAYLGTWWEDKTLYLDVSRKIEDHYEAHKTAYKQDQVALYGVKGQKVHWVMGDHSRPTDKSGSKPLFESKAAPDKLFFDARHLDPKKIAQEVADKFCPDLPEG